jgi:HAD superfamily hydrolase (TIGR01509 family)
MTPELFIFDCDGVLIDSEPVASRILWKSLQRAGVMITEAEVHRRFTGYSETDARRICIDELGLTDCDEAFAHARDNLDAEFARSLTPMAGMAQLVASLKGRKCVASNSTLERLRNSLGLFDLWSEFAPNIFSADMVARPKPAPDLFVLCAETLGVDPARCVVIDDSPHGITGAVTAGMKAIGFVDPADPRQGREAVLFGAGATMVATGSEELATSLESMLPGAFQRSMPNAAAEPTFI